jgi:hypothetical protein
MNITRNGVSIRVDEEWVDGNAVRVLERSRLPIGESAPNHPRRRSYATTNASSKKIIEIGRNTGQPA